jgi:hypothetical protein
MLESQKDLKKTAASSSLLLDLKIADRLLAPPEIKLINLGKKTYVEQGCQIFLDTKYQNVEKYTKLPQKIPNGHM